MFATWLPISSSQASAASRSASNRAPLRLRTTGPVDAADAGEDGERVLLGPLHRRLGPLGGTRQVAELLAGPDEAAVHLAGRVRAQPALDREQHGLVEVPEPLGDLAPVDEDPTHGLQRLGLEVGRTERPAQPDRLGGEHGGPVQVAAAVGQLGLTQDEGAVLDAPRLAVERPARPAQPTAGDGRPGLEGVVLVEPHRALARPAPLAELVERAVGDLPGHDAVVEAAEPPCRLGDHVGPPRLRLG